MKRTAIILFLIVIAAAAARFAGLGSKSLWLDETMSVRRARGSVADTICETAGHDAHPPLYYVLQHLTKPLPPSDAAPRLISAAAGILLIPVVFLIARKLMNPLAGFLAAALSALSAFQVYYSQEARPYALMMLLSAFSLLLFLHLRQDDKRLGNLRIPTWLAYNATAVAMLYTNYYLSFVLLAECMILVVMQIRSGNLKSSAGRAFLYRWVAGRLIALLAFAPYVAVIVRRIHAMPAAPVQSRLELIASFPQALVRMLTGIETELPALISLLLVAVAIAPIVAGMTLLYRNRLAFASIAASILVPVLCVLVLPWRLQIFEPKHLIFIAPILILPAAFVPSAFPRRPLAWSGYAVLLAANLFALADYYRPDYQKERWPEAVSIIRSELQPGDAVLFNPYYAVYPFHHYADSSIEAARLLMPLNLDQLEAGIRPWQRIWLVEVYDSNVAVPMPTHRWHIETNYRLSSFQLGRDQAEHAILPGRNGTILIRVFSSPEGM